MVRYTIQTAPIRQELLRKKKINKLKIREVSKTILYASCILIGFLETTTKSLYTKKLSYAAQEAVTNLLHRYTASPEALKAPSVCSCSAPAAFAGAAEIVAQSSSYHGSPFQPHLSALNHMLVSGHE